jgi:hypothetical protein
MAETLVIHIQLGAQREAIERVIFAELRLPGLGVPRRLASQVSEKDEENNEHRHEEEGLHNHRAKQFCFTLFAVFVCTWRRGWFIDGGRVEPCPATPAPKSAPSAPDPERIRPISPSRRADFRATAVWTDHRWKPHESWWTRRPILRKCGESQ